MASLLVVCYESTNGKYFVQQIGAAQITVASLTSSLIAAGAIGTPHLAAGAVTSAKIAANAIGGPHILDGSILGADLANATITSAQIGASVIGGVHILDGSIAGADLAAAAVTSGKIAAGAIGGVHILDGSIVSGDIAANAIGGGHIVAGGVISGNIGSGQIGTTHLAADVAVNISQIGQEQTFPAADLISAYLCIQYSTSNYFNYARANAVATMPALGLATANIASGQVGTFQYRGRIQNTGWNFSGYVGNLVYVGTSSEVTLITSGMTVSGTCIQRFGKVATPNTVFVSPDLTFVQLAQ